MPPDIHENLLKSGFYKPMPIQERAVPLIQSGRDVIIHSATGSGKTLSFLVPLLSKLQKVDDTPVPLQVLMLMPSQELAVQTARECRQLLAGTGHFLELVVTGDTTKQFEQIRDTKASVLVGTPKVMWEIVKYKKGALPKLKRLQVLVVDEVDALVPPPPELPVWVTKKIIEEEPHKLPAPLRRRVAPKPTAQLLEKLVHPGMQLCFASATVDPSLSTKLQSLIIEHKQLKYRDRKGCLSICTAPPAHPTSKNIKGRGVAGVKVPTTLKFEAVACRGDAALMRALQVSFSMFAPRAPLLVVSGSLVPAAFSELLQQAGFSNALCLTDAIGLREAGKEGVAQHHLDQFNELSSRYKAKEEEMPLLVSDAVSIRGVDLPWIDYVFLVNLPQDANTFVHLAGRTGREGRKGNVVCVLKDEEQLDKMDSFVKELGIRVAWTDLTKSN